MHRPGSDYRHKPYRKQISARDVFFSVLKFYIIVFTVLYISVWLTKQNYFQFKNISIEGVHASDLSLINNIVHSQNTKKFLIFWNRNNFLLYPEDSVKNKIYETDSRISDVKILKNKNSLVVSIKEFEPKIRYCIVDKNNAVEDTQDKEKLDTENNGIDIPSQDNENGASTSSEVVSNKVVDLEKIPDLNLNRPDESSYSCFWSDENGYIFAKTPIYSGIPIFTIIERNSEKIAFLVEKGGPIGNQIFEKDHYTKLMNTIELLRTSGLHAQEVQNLDNGDFIIDIGYPWVIVANFNQNPGSTVDNLLLALKELNITEENNQSKIKYIDLRFPNKVFYK